MTTAVWARMPNGKQCVHKFVNFLGSKKFFGVVVGLLILQAAWIALTARYPQAFDEQFHFGLIQLHAQQLNPFFTHQPAGADIYGAISRDPSYLYHYLMSLPYRVIAHVTHDQTIQVVSLRFINISFMVGALFVLRRALSLTGASKALIQTCLFFFVITPVVPLLASQINYDNLLILLVGLSAWWTLTFLDSLRLHKKWRWDTLSELFIICLFASLVKYAFLPIFVVIFGFVVHAWWLSRKKIKFGNPFRVLSRLRIVLYVLLLLISASMFVERYGVNTVRYHTPTPECDQVLSIDACQAYAPWARNYNNVQHKQKLKEIQEFAYPLAWMRHSVSELVFAIGSGYNKQGTVDYYTGTQLPIPEIIVWVFFTCGVLAALVYRKWYWRSQSARLFAAIIGLYLLALLGQNWSDYLHIGQLTAIHGRYFLPVLPFIYVLTAMGIRKAVHDMPRIKGLTATYIKVGIVVVVSLLMTQGGGIVTYIVRSDPWWFWPQSSAAQDINAHAKKLLKPHVIGTNKD